MSKRRRLTVKVLRRRTQPKIILTPDPLGLNEGKPSHTFGRIGARIKESSKGKPWAIPNEFICAEIGRFIRLPIAAYALACCDDDARTQVFCSLLFNYDERDPYPFRPEACVEFLPQLAAGVLVFDIFICNSDRHSSNLEVDDDLQPRVMQIFDHDIALLGNYHFGGLRRLEKLKDRLGVTDGPVTGGCRHVLIDAVKTNEHFETWVHRIELIPHRWLTDLCDEAKNCGLSSDEAIVAAKFLNDRKMRLRTLLNRNASEFKGIASWRTL